MKNRSTTAWLWLVLSTLLFAGAAQAGSLYLPLSVNQEQDGKLYRSIVWVTNIDNEAARVEVRFIPTGTNGTVQPNRVDDAITLQPGQTAVLPGAFGALGMLEVRSDASIAAVSELNSFDGSEKMSSASVPLISVEMAAAANTPLDLLALERQVVGSRSNLGVVNFGTQPAVCSIRTFRPGGEPIGATVRVRVRPMGHEEFQDAFGLLDEPSVDGARFRVRCDQPFYAYATLLGRYPDTTHYVSPAGRALEIGDNGNEGEDSGGGDGGGGNDDGGAGGGGGGNDDGGGGGGNPGAPQVILQRNGQFFVGSHSNPLFELNVPLRRGVDYRSVTVDLDLYAPDLPNDLFTSTVQLRRGGRNGLFWAHTVRGARRLKSILDMGGGDNFDITGNAGVWKGRANHHMRIHYDAVANRVQFDLFRNGQKVETLTGRLYRRDLRHDGQGIQLIFGQAKVVDNAFFPPWGFRFSNLKVTAQER